MTQVTQVEMLPRIMIREDPEVSELVRRRFEAEGIRVLTGHKAKQFVVEDGEKVLVAEHAGADVRIAFEAVLVAVGRIANTSGYGLEELGIGTTQARTVETDDFLQTIYPNIFAACDVAGPYQFTHTASHQAWYAAVNALFGSFRRFKADYRVIPWATFTEPEVARVGLNETEALLEQTIKQYFDGLSANVDRKGNITGVRGLVSPHIDYQRGGSVYAGVWHRAAAAVREAELAIILGTNHQAGHKLVTLTKKSYATPWGELPVACDVVDAVVNSLGEKEVYEEEVSHRNEHSVEAADVWLHYFSKNRQ